MTPNVSIIIPCFNAARWLGQTIDSALAQTASGCEIIVIDDGSTDESRNIARGYAERGVRVAGQPNRGASAARNHGLRLAQGKFIEFLDADDVLAPDKIALQLALLAAGPADCIAAGSWSRFETSIARAVCTPEENWRDCDPVEWLALNFSGRGMMPPAAWLTPRELVARAGPWDERLTLNDDGEYFCRVILASAGVRFCPAAMTYYRSNLPDSLSRRRSAAAWESAFLSQELCVDHLLAREDSARARRAGANLFQRLAYEMYPDCPHLVASAEARVNRHGGADARPQGGAAFRWAARLLGWKAARRWQQRRSRAGKPAASPADAKRPPAG